MLKREAYRFYATFDVSSLCSYIPPVPVLLPASSWARLGLKKPTLPEQITERAADSGGFVASRIWGEYRYSLAQYVDWLGTWQPQWAAMMDYCCEPELQQVTRERQDRTTQKAWQTWHTYRHVPWLWVPTIQGLTPADYERHAQELLPLLHEMQTAYRDNPLWRVGIGTLCRRANVQTIRAVVQAVVKVLPNIPLHLWGVKLASLRSLDMRHVVSTDSAAWHGLFHTQRHQMTQAAHALGYSRREYAVKVNLPAYLAKVEAAVNESWARYGTDIDIAPLRTRLAQVGWTLHLRRRNDRPYVYAARKIAMKTHEVYLGALAQVVHLTDVDLYHQLGISPARRLPNVPSLWNMQEQNV